MENNSANKILSFLVLYLAYVVLILGISFLIRLIVDYSISPDESSCYQFYRENGFVLDSCEEYKEKFESLGEK